MKANKKPLWESLRPKSAAGKSFSYEDLQNFDLKKMVTHFSLMCPGVSLSTLTHDVSLYGSLSFKQICSRKTAKFLYINNPSSTDIATSDEQLIRRPSENKHYDRKSPYSVRQVYMPDIEMTTDLVGDTEMISTFIDKYEITDVKWLHWFHKERGSSDLVIGPFVTRARRHHQGVPPHRHTLKYIFTKHPEQTSELSL